MKKRSLLFLALVASSALWAEVFTVDSIKYITLGGDSVEVTSKLYGYSGDITIPATVIYDSTTYRVVRIGYASFYGCTALKSITISKGVTRIGDEAFRNCDSLTSASIPEGVTSIGYRAFYVCRSLTSVNIPEGVTSIGYSAFRYCLSIDSITIPESVTSIGVAAFYGCSSLKSINIPSGLDSIEDGVFYDCISLTSITIPDRVTSIGSNAFSGCSSLDSITIPKDVTNLGNYVFYGCSALSYVHIPNKVPRLGNQAFYRCYSLKSIKIPNSVTDFGGSVFAGCTSLDSVIIPNGLTKIEDGAFAGCTSLTTITIPNSVTIIGSHAFNGCTALKSITIPNNVTRIGERAFNGCIAITAITCYDTTPPVCGSYVFENINKSIPVYVPANSISAYQAANQWKAFANILPISADSVSAVISVVATATDNSVTITWPTDTAAASYIVEVKQDSTVFCTLTFNAQGQMTDITYAPSRGTGNAVAMAEAVNGGYRFTITGLDSGSSYIYEVDTKNAAGTSIASYTGEFTTTGGITSLDQLSDTSVHRFTKVINNGRFLILRDHHTYSATGQELR